eukprot:SAG31_NODE_1546_length_7927_cov_29.239525_7_plen_42_part_00
MRQLALFKFKFKFKFKFSMEYCSTAVQVPVNEAVYLLEIKF